MRELQKTLTLEQKEAVYEFVAGWIKSGRKLDTCTFENMRSITDGNIEYIISMSNFDINKFFSISVSNSKLNVRISIHTDQIHNKSLVQYIENHMKALLSMDKGELTDEEFNEITNLEVDLSMSRSRKVRHLMDKINE